MRIKQNTAFTLVETLVAIGIVATLAMLVLTASRTVIAKGNEVKCIANLKSSGRAMLNYFQDHDGRFFPKKYWFQYSSYRANANTGMREYFDVEPDLDIADSRLKVETMLTCPGILARYPNVKNDAFRRGYGANYYLFRTMDGTQIPSFGNLRSVSKLSKLWMLADGAVAGGADNYEVGGLLGSINDNTAYHKTQYLTYPHGNRNNFVFFDGHVEGMTREELLTKRNKAEFWGSTQMAE